MRVYRAKLRVDSGVAKIWCDGVNVKASQNKNLQVSLLFCSELERVRQGYYHYVLGLLWIGN